MGWGHPSPTTLGDGCSSFPILTVSAFWGMLGWPTQAVHPHGHGKGNDTGYPVILGGDQPHLSSPVILNGPGLTHGHPPSSLPSPNVSGFWGGRPHSPGRDDPGMGGSRLPEEPWMRCQPSRVTWEWWFFSVFHLPLSSVGMWGDYPTQTAPGY